MAAANQLLSTLGIGLLIALVGSDLYILPLLAARLGRRGTEALDGFVIGAFGALCFSAAGTITWFAPQFGAGLIDNFRPWRLFEEG